MGTFVPALAALGLTWGGDDSEPAFEEECAALASAHGLDAEGLARECEVLTVTRRATALAGLTEAQCSEICLAARPVLLQTPLHPPACQPS